jgi:hypothetical protein
MREQHEDTPHISRYVAGRIVSTGQVQLARLADGPTRVSPDTCARKRLITLGCAHGAASATHAGA